MKKIMMILMIAVSVSTVAFGQTKASNDKNAGNKRSDEQAIRQAVGTIAAALSKNDVAGLDRVWADGYIFIGANGSVATKAQRFAQLKSGEVKYESVSFDEVDVHLFGDTAIVVFTVTSKFQANGQSSGGKYKTIGTFVKRKGRWMEISAQLTSLAE